MFSSSDKMTGRLLDNFAAMNEDTTVKQPTKQNSCFSLLKDKRARDNHCSLRHFNT